MDANGAHLHTHAIILDQRMPPVRQFQQAHFMYQTLFTACINNYATGVTDYFQQRALNPLGLAQYSAEVIVMTLVSKCIHDPLIPT